MCRRVAQSLQIIGHFLLAAVEPVREGCGEILERRPVGRAGRRRERLAHELQVGAHRGLTRRREVVLTLRLLVEQATKSPAVLLHPPEERLGGGICRPGPNAVTGSVGGHAIR